MTERGITQAACRCLCVVMCFADGSSKCLSHWQGAHSTLRCAAGDSGTLSESCSAPAAAMSPATNASADQMTDLLIHLVQAVTAGAALAAKLLPPRRPRRSNSQRQALAGSDSGSGPAGRQFNGCVAIAPCGGAGGGDSGRAGAGKALRGCICAVRDFQ